MPSSATRDYNFMCYSEGATPWPPKCSLLFGKLVPCLHAACSMQRLDISYRMTQVCADVVVIVIRRVESRCYIDWRFKIHVFLASFLMCVNTFDFIIVETRLIFVESLSLCTSH